MDAFEILVVILSVSLFILLICTIIFVIKLTQLLKLIQRISERAENVMEDVESVGEFFKRSAGPVAIGRLVGMLIQNVTHTGDKKGRK